MIKILPSYSLELDVQYVSLGSVQAASPSSLPLDIGLHSALISQLQVQLQKEQERELLKTITAEDLFHLRSPISLTLSKWFDLATTLRIKGKSQGQNQGQGPAQSQTDNQNQMQGDVEKNKNIKREINKEIKVKKDKKRKYSLHRAIIGEEYFKEICSFNNIHTGTKASLWGDLKHKQVD